MSTVITGPVPPYSNLPIESQNFQPSRFVISEITLGQTTTITTTENVNYVIGQICRLIIPPTFGCTQLNELQGYVINIPNANQVTLSINSSVNVDPYISSSATTLPQILASGDINSGALNANGINSTLTYVPGAFINVSE